MDGRSVNCRANLARAVIKKTNISKEIDYFCNNWIPIKLVWFNLQFKYTVLYKHYYKWEISKSKTNKSIYVILIYFSILMANQWVAVEHLLLLQVTFECGVPALKAGDFPGDPCSMSPFQANHMTFTTTSTSWKNWESLVFAWTLVLSVVAFACSIAAHQVRAVEQILPFSLF